MKAQNKSLFFLFVFVCQLCMMNVISISFAVAKELSKVDQETSLEYSFADQLDADEGDFSLLIDEELEKEYFDNMEFITPFYAKRSNFYYHKNDHSSLIDFKNHQPPEVIS
jgi:hypothetical protein